LKRQSLSRGELGGLRVVGCATTSEAAKLALDAADPVGNRCSNTQLFNHTLEDLLLFVQRLPPLMFLCLDNLLSQIRHIDFQGAARGISLWLGEVE